MELVIVTGLSGSGKSVVLNVLEDTGYYCVDNLPAQLISDAVKFLENKNYSKVAVSMDVRSGTDLANLPSYIKENSAKNRQTHIIFLDAKNETLIKRFSETRRRHPLANDRLTLAECIDLERELLYEVNQQSHRIDTSELNPAQLRNWVKELLKANSTNLVLLFQSFGFKHSPPLDSDLVFDVRCLPNPYHIPELRHFNGKDAKIIQFLEDDILVTQMISDIKAFLDKWLPSFVKDGRNYLTVAIGCTGGIHRSVYITEALAKKFKNSRSILIRHRELKNI